MRLAAVAAAVLLAVAWVLTPLRTRELVTFLQPESALDAPVRELRGPLPAPVRYAYRPACEERTAGCGHWTLVTSTGERWWVPGAGADDDRIALSRDGRRLAYVRDGHLTLRDLAAGSVKRIRVRKAGHPAFFRDGRHLLVRGAWLVVDAERGGTRRLKGRGRVAGWTAGGVVLATSRSSRAPGHLTAVTYTVHSADGKAVRWAELPGNLDGATPSPSGRALAVLPDEVTRHGRAVRDVVLIDPATRAVTRTVTPRLPAGWRAEEIVRWEDEGALVLRTSGPWKEDDYQVLDLATGDARRLAITVPGVTDELLYRANLIVEIGDVSTAARTS
ncbi:hypothetical protein [Nonomuraea sp. SBT364]|uniref:hypothetical protein n=1 Tax=Nonomuraea sp. SBT364 TaxID=1580530 RepID=UPI00066AD5AD|nr:hypothetical protein [Nonomuraea sp. SBT364]